MSKRALLCLLAVLLAGCAGKAPAPVDNPEAPATAAQPARTAPAQAPAAAEKRAPLVEEDNIFFRTGATQIDPAERHKLQPHAQRLKADSKQLLTLVGHTDDQGSRSYNLAIAESRVDAVFQALRSLGVPARQLQRYPAGEEMAGTGCQSSECRRLMRRVELIYRPQS